MGGTCVNVGCVPKKVRFVQLSHTAERRLVPKSAGLMKM